MLKYFLHILKIFEILNFKNKLLIEKVFYSLGFDSILFFSRGIGRKFKGLLGEYTKNGSQIFIEPKKIGFN